jgi:hypothetical protein
MNNLVTLFDSLRELYLRYLDSPLDMRYADLRRERRELLNQDRRLWREPLIEPVPAYPTAGSDFPGIAHTLLDQTWGREIANDVAGFLGPSFFTNLQTGEPILPYSHQRDVFQHSLVDERDVVVTTGTGSGKTECFLVPVLAQLVRESRTWSSPGPRSPRWDWWDERHRTMRGKNPRYAPRTPQRAHEAADRPAAMRALVLYPLNALVEDQLVRLRVALDSTIARGWLDNNRRGNRIYFGRYTGRTPIPGRDDTARLRSELAQMAREATAVAGSSAETFFQKLDGAEMWSRWDMQDDAPDLLITNYSMLNIMLMRSIEAPIFNQTRDWLAADPHNVFHLVVDELHTYRGTPGTEVAYLLRVLLDRLNLDPASDQLRIIASSASLEGGESGLTYLQEFFGRHRDRFRIVSGTPTTPNPQAVEACGRFAQSFRTFGLTAKQNAGAIDEAAQTLANAVQVEPAQHESARLLREVVLKTEAGEALRAACYAEGALRPRTPSELGEILFPLLPDAERDQATEGLLLCTSAARPAPVRLRGHLFFRSVQGIWACTNPRCTRAANRQPSTPVGKLYHQPVLSCGCGARVLELLVCECCGEIFFGGYKRDDPLNPGVFYLSPDHPNLETAPEMAFLDRSYENYSIFWPSPARSPITPTWSQDNVQRRWQEARLESREASVALGAGPGSRGFIYRVPNPTSAANQAYPAYCPRCDEDRRRRRLDTPIRPMRTGFQRVAQVLSDTLLREMPQAGAQSNRKLVVFSDSRQDAAKLSAGMRSDHYRDTVRQALATALDTAGRGAAAFQKQFGAVPLLAEEQRMAQDFEATHPREANILSAAQLPGRANLPATGFAGLTNTQAAQQIVQRGEQGPFALTQLTEDIAARLLIEGINPGGFSQTVLWSDARRHEGWWKHLYDWPSDQQPDIQPAARVNPPLAPHEQEQLQRIRDTSFREVTDAVFASGRRSHSCLIKEDFKVC